MPSTLNGEERCLENTSSFSQIIERLGIKPMVISSSAYPKSSPMMSSTVITPILHSMGKDRYIICEMSSSAQLISKILISTTSTFTIMSALMREDGTICAHTVSRDKKPTVPTTVTAKNPYQIIAAFDEMPICALTMDRFVIIKLASFDINNLPIDLSSLTLPTYIYHGKGKEALPVNTHSLEHKIRHLQDLTDSVVFIRTEFPLHSQYLQWMREGRKVTTIRFRRHAIEIPTSSTPPLFETIDYSTGDRSRPAKHMRIQSVHYKRFGELSDDDARRDGFNGLDHMRRDFTQIYPLLTHQDWITIYDVTLAD